MKLNAFVFCLCLMFQAEIGTGDNIKEPPTLWSHGCRGIPGLEQSVNKLRCPADCRIIIHQVKYAMKNTPGCPYEISHPVEPRCCQPETTDDCYQNKSRKIPMLQLLCREAANVCELAVDRVVLRCPRNAFSISSQRSIRYGCACESISTTTSSGPKPTQGTLVPTIKVPETSPRTTTTLLSTVTSTTGPSSKAQHFPGPTTLQPSISPLNSGSPRRSFVTSTIPKTQTTELVTESGEHLSSTVQQTTVISTSSTTTTLGVVPTTSTTTAWTITAKDIPEVGILPKTNESGDGQNQYHSDESQSSKKTTNATLIGGVIGGAGFLFLVSIMATIFICVKRKQRKSETQGTEEASQYAYEIMDISLRRPQPIVTQPPEMTSLEASDEYNDISLDNQTENGTFLEKKIQRYLITSIYAEIKDFKRLSQESAEKKAIPNQSGGTGTTNKTGNPTAIVKPTPKPRKISDLYAKVNKRAREPLPEIKKDDSFVVIPETDKKEHLFTVGRGDVEMDKTPVCSKISGELYSNCGSPTLVLPGRRRSPEGSGQLVKDTYDRLVHRDGKRNDTDGDRVGSGPYDELYSPKEGTESANNIKYFNNCEYSTLNVQNGRVSLVSNNSNRVSTEPQ